MKKRFLGFILLALFILSLGGLIACNRTKNVSINYGYYFYSTSQDPNDNTKVNSTVWVQLFEDKTWASSDNSNGFYEIKGKSVILRKSSYSSYIIANYEGNYMSIYGTDGVYMVQNQTAQTRLVNELSTFDEISTIEDLLAIDDNESNASVSYVLTNDLDFTNYTKEVVTNLDGEEEEISRRTFLEPLFLNTSYAFSGILDGAGHTIKCFNIEATSDNSAVSNYAKGLISKTDGAIIRNLNFEDVEIDTSSIGSEPIGIVVGRAIDTTFKNISISTSVNIAATGQPSTKALEFGNFCGEAIDSNFLYCKFEMAETFGTIFTPRVQVNNSIFLNMYIGGIVGATKGDTLINQCYYNAPIDAIYSITDISINQAEYEADISVGGILGKHLGEGNITISNCYVRSIGDSGISCRASAYNNNNAIHKDIKLGGIVGSITDGDGDSHTIVNCALVGKTSGEANQKSGNFKAYVGGIAGYTKTEIKNSFIDASVDYNLIESSLDGTNNIECTVAGISAYSDLNGCFIIGVVNGVVTLDAGTLVTKERTVLNVVRFTLDGEMNGCLYDASFKLAGNLRKTTTRLISDDFIEIRNSVPNTTPLEERYSRTAVSKSDKLTTISTLYSIGFKQYKNIMDVTKYPENAWRITQGILPTLNWI